MRFEQLRALFRSLRFRLSVWNTLAVLMIVVVTLVGVHEALRVTLLNEYDLLLREDANEVMLAAQEYYPHLGQIQSEIDRKAEGHIDREFFVQLVKPDGSVLLESGHPPELENLPAATLDRPIKRTVGDSRVVQTLLTAPGIPQYTVRVGASMRIVENDLSTVTRLMLFASVVILFVAPVSGYWLAGRATRPLARINHTAARLRPDHIDERLPIRHTGDELDQLSLCINHFLDLLREYLDRNREFVANAAHELRSPLAAIQSSVEVTLNSERTVGEYQDLLGEIADQCEHLRLLVNQLLLLAETDSMKSVVDKQFLRFDELLQRSIEMFRGVGEERGIRLNLNLRDQVTIEGDPARLRQVINNLIDNGLKFTPTGGRVIVTMYLDHEAHQVVLKVADTGLGINAEDLPLVFERFYRGDRSRQRGSVTFGNGLGLSICHSIVTAHGGTIDAESVPGRGATFTVRLPLPPAIASEVASSSESVGQTSV